MKHPENYQNYKGFGFGLKGRPKYVRYIGSHWFRSDFIQIKNSSFLYFTWKYNCFCHAPWNIVNWKGCNAKTCLECKCLCSLIDFQYIVCTYNLSVNHVIEYLLYIHSWFNKRWIKFVIYIILFMKILGYFSFNYKRYGHSEFNFFLEIVSLYCSSP